MNLALKTVTAVLFAAGYGLLGLVILLLVLPPFTGVEVRDVVSGSMEPNVPMHAVAVTRPVSSKDVAVGDVILFKEPRTARTGVVYGFGTRRPVLHRVIAVTVDDEGRREFETLGDANGTADGWVVTDSDLMGKLVVDIPRLGHLFNFMATRSGYFLFVVIPGLLVMVPELLVIYRWARWGAVISPSAANATVRSPA